MSKPNGRPSKYKSEWDQLLIDHMTKGFSYETFAGICKVNIDTLYEWEKVHESFSEAKKQAVALCRIFWEDVGMRGMQGKIRGFNAAVWIFSMKNRFKWHDNVQLLKDPDDKSKENEIEKLAKELATLKATASDDPCRSV